MHKWYNRDVTVKFEYIDDLGSQASVSASMSQGKLLMPLGSGLHWLLHKHKGFNITVTNKGKNLKVPRIVKMELLKLHAVSPSDDL